MELKIFYIYKIVNVLNNKIYIGQTIHPNKRWYEHRKSASHKNPIMAITRAIKKYGADKFEFELIACCKNQEDVDYSEDQLINQYNSKNSDHGYNIKGCGTSAPHSEQSKMKI